ncbi:hypothetical protein EDD18DRAFT_679791 [Armillaria luteobubalina]|uniref:Nephrocystin 3-like N-terminal domain-containing protein n=1 Tax=Armillaria luteobubalina TaxID=153913 RepID=A0AA39QFP1_9AGAR|nr:hypothetical protein EDD18DRAFT_679791 [Armillaria luteobubalina]
MKGTCVEAINYLMSWIAQCSGGMLWCKDLVGMGTSSLAGMLHDLLTVHISTRKRLGAFVRYDRVEYSDASHLIMSIAYSLGMSDNRIGAAISKVIGRNRAVLSMAPSEQFRLLLKGPLESLRVLANEGPLVVVIDGIEECDPSNEMLAVLSRGFGQRLPFMRLLVFSRPTELLSRAFTAPNSAVTTFILDTASIQAGCDIESASVW